MKQDALSRWIRLMIVGVGLCGIVVYAAAVPMLAEEMVERYPEFASWEWPWLVLIWITAVPCVMALAFFWKIAVNIGADRSFSLENSRLLKWISILAALDAGIFFVGNLTYLLLGMNHPSIVLFSLLIEFSGLAASVAFAALSHLVGKAAELQEQSDLTI